jgi:hypothetical protein
MVHKAPIHSSGEFGPPDRLSRIPRGRPRSCFVATRTAQCRVAPAFAMATKATRPTVKCLKGGQTNRSGQEGSTDARDATAA